MTVQPAQHAAMRRTISRADFAHIASALAAKSAEWASCSISPGKAMDEPMPQDSIDTFCARIRNFLEMMNGQ